MNSQKGNLTTSTAILLSAGMISFAILLSGGIIKIKGLTAYKSTAAPAAQAGTNPQPAVQPQVQPAQPQQPLKVSVGHLPTKGNKDAKVTVIEFADFRCPFCEKFYTETGSQLFKNYVDSGKVRFAYRHYAFLGPASTIAATASECANEQGKFWEFHDYLFKNQPSESDTSLYTTDKLTPIAQSLGVDSAKFQSCLNSKKFNSIVSDDLADGQKAGVTGTPAVIIGKTDGDSASDAQLIVGAQPYANFQAAIDALLK